MRTNSSRNLSECQKSKLAFAIDKSLMMKDHILSQIQVEKGGFSTLRYGHLPLFFALSMGAAAQAYAVDTDGDTIDDAIDIDDDNDGILDTEEGAPESFTLSGTTPNVVITGDDTGNTFTNTITMVGDTPSTNIGVADTAVTPGWSLTAGTDGDTISTITQIFSAPVNGITISAPNTTNKNSDTIIWMVTWTGGVAGATGTVNDNNPLDGVSANIYHPDSTGATPVFSSGPVTSGFQFIMDNNGELYEAITPNVDGTTWNSEFDFSITLPDEVTSVTVTGVFETGVNVGTFNIARETMEIDFSGATIPGGILSDADSDGVSNHIDLDSDNDGISDLIESGTSVANIAADTDGDGSISLAEAAAITGASGDADGDGLLDIFDEDITDTSITNSEGTDPTDTDGDGVPDYLEVLEVDTDGDSVPDSIDIDDDNDGILDIEEGFTSFPPTTSVGATDPFVDGEPGFYQVINGEGPDAGAIYLFDITNEVYTPIGTPSGIEQNGLMYDTGTDFLFSMARSSGTDSVGNDVITGDLLKVDRGGEVFLSGRLGDTVSAADYYNGQGYVRSSNTKITVVDLTLPTGSIVDPTILSFTTDTSIAHEIVFSGSVMHWVGTGTNILYWVDVAGVSDGDVLTVQSAAVAGLPSGTFGTGFAALNTVTGEPELYFSQNGTGSIYRIDDFGTATPSSSWNAPSTISNSTDGAAPADTPPPLAYFLSDVDGDGVKNYTDLDSDNDGISDLYESGTTAANIAADTNADGFISLAESAAIKGTNGDIDGDGLMDIFDARTNRVSALLSVGTVPVDTDGDALEDHLDLDSDADGIPDTTEALATTGYAANDGNVSDNDIDGDGIIDLFDTNDTTSGIFGGTGMSLIAPIDTDGDAVADFLDTDSDNDAITDALEGGSAISMAATYPDPDGSVNDPLSAADDSDLLLNADNMPAEVDYRSVQGTAPVVTDETKTVAANTTSSTGLANNITDVDGDAVLTTIDLDPATSGVQSSITTTEGGWTVSAAGVLRFNPVNTFQGIATIPYTVTDATGLVSNSAEVVITVEGAVPVATVDSVSGAAGSIVTIDLADNITDANGDAEITTIDLNPGLSGVQRVLNTDEGKWSIDTAGELSFDPVSTFQGTTSTPYTVMDRTGLESEPAIVTVTIAGAAPSASADSGAALANTIAVIDLSDNIFDVNGDVDVTTIDLNPGQSGVQRVLNTDDGKWTIDAAGELSFEPVSTFQGAASIPYTVMDETGLESSPATVTVTITGTAPIASDASASVLANKNATINLSGKIADVNSDADLSTIDLDPATAGVQSSITTAAGGWAVTAAGVLKFNPVTAFQGTTTIPYTVMDATGLESNSADVSVTVAGATPVATDDSASVLANTTATIDLSDNVTDANSDSDITTIDLNGARAGVQSELTTDDGVWSVDSAGLLTFVPAPSFAGVAAIPYLVSDDEGNVSEAAVIEVTVGTATPVADNDSETMVENATITIDVLDGDNDANNDIDPATIDLDPDASGIQATKTVAGEGVYEVVAGEVVFTPAAEYFGTSSVDYTVSDAAGNVSNVASIDVTILIDTDGDGTDDIADSDDDNDGISDLQEGTEDTDGDGIIDSLDSDSDNDTIPDDVEAGADPDSPQDTDGDGIPNFLEVDSDNDGILDSVEGLEDTDGDGVSNHVDEDSDDDGIPDAVETGIDTDSDSIPDYLDIDSDNDGISDSLEMAADTDADGAEDFRDLDSDNDGIYDLIEARIGQVEVNLIDTDNNGIVDFSNVYGLNGMADIVETAPDSGLENYELPDIDGDGIADYRDLDSDNDGILDTYESDHADADRDGVIDTVGAVTRTTLAVDIIGLASDAGGLPRNTDGDALSDFRDGDSDNDGIMDVVESFGVGFDLNNDAMLDNFVDSNGDGVSDNLAANPLAPTDTDNDGVIDALELDSDADGIRDLLESGGIDTDGTGMIDGFTDDNSDGVDDTVAVVPIILSDADGDGIPDFQEIDSDSDGLSDLFESGGVDVNGDGEADSVALTLKDTDGNGIPDYQETPVIVTPEEPIEVVSPIAPGPIATNGQILTGLGGGGCAIPDPLNSNTTAPIDPMLPALSVLSLMGLALRRRLLNVIHPGEK